MQITFGETVRRLRRGRGLTQEQLAQRLSVAFQTISNWERGECTPDLGMLPAIAGFFGVSTDELLGVNQAENERRIQEILGYFDNNFRDMGQWEAYNAALREALKRNPSDYRLWELHFGLLTSLSVGDTTESLNARLPEVLSVYGMILENCTVDAIRSDVRGTMCHFYSGILRYDPDDSAAQQALERIVSELPDLYDTRQYVGPMHLHRPDEQMKTVCHEAITHLPEVFGGMATHLTNRIDDEREDVQVRQAMLDVFDAVYPDGDYGRNWGHVVSLWEFIALKHAKEFREYDKAFEALRRAIALARAHDAQPQAGTHTSPMLRGFVYEKPPGPNGMDTVRRVLGDELKGLFDWPEEFKNDPRYGEILSSLD
ncbi:MAG: helix-turn-helix transcriptional regulator [Oscillospiraceae bacterium]|jgi:transcriptional regulator with XRE-family HTH domain|nr:helix-turn-helix transcriptional regulator [Oscillospiraceae bacterium]